MSNVKQGTEHSPISRCQPGPAGFTLVEILIVVVILGILATIVIPQFSSASSAARQNTLKDELRYLRTQIPVFTAQHRDIAPGYPGGNTSATPTSAIFIAQMTQYTDSNCNVSATPTATATLGPYLSQMPSNPINSNATIMVLANGAPVPAPDNSTGWIYQPQTQQIMANSPGNDSSGVAYASY